MSFMYFEDGHGPPFSAAVVELTPAKIPC